MDSCKEEDDENDMTDDIDTRKDSGSVSVRHEAKFQIESPTGLPSRVDGLVAQVVGRFRRKHERKKKWVVVWRGGCNFGRTIEPGGSIFSGFVEWFASLDLVNLSSDFVALSTLRLAQI